MSDGPLRIRSKRGPLGLDATVSVGTAEPFYMADVIAAIRQHIG